ncbi:fascin domain-containing protein [Rhizohabitans arisaemae]|uniref:fascin domain-containing protein n=1 Tax=Rhizohabitans arisaemae TaxID=2720610 RepID=UPI0024B0BCD8|nr:hypothetical protein [Rhizohabitans arisaemae]
MAAVAVLAFGVPAQAATSSVPAGISISQILASGVRQSACMQNVTFTSQANGRLVSAELGNGGELHAMLRARATAIGEWELYTVCIDGANSFLYSQANGAYVSAELGNGGGLNGMLRARASELGAWERFSLESCGTGCVAIRSSANGLYVSAELGNGGGLHGMLRARASTVGAWERFQ